MKKILLLILIPFALFSQSIKEYNEQGFEAYENKDYQVALISFVKSLKEDSNQIQIIIKKGLTNIKLKNYENALNDFTRVIILSNNDSVKIDYLVYKAYILRNKIIDLDQALLFSQKAVSMDSMSWKALHMHGLILHDLNKLKDAIACFDLAISIMPSKPDVYYDRAIAYRKLKNYAKSIEDNTLAIQQDSSYAKAYTNRGYTKLLLKDYKGSIDDYTKAIELEKSAYAYNNRGFAKYNLGDYESARKDCEKSLTLDPKNSWAYHYLGLIYFELGNTQKACKLFYNALDLGKQDVKADINTKCKV